MELRFNEEDHYFPRNQVDLNCVCETLSCVKNTEHNQCKILTDSVEESEGRNSQLS